MGNFLETIKRSVQVWCENLAQHVEDARQAELDVEVRKKIQVTEYNGDLFVCVDGVPLLGVDDLKNTLTQTVQTARDRYKDWEDEKRWRR